MIHQFRYPLSISLDLDDDGWMTHQLAVLDHGLDLLAKVAAGSNLRPEEVSSGKMTHRVLLLQPRGLSALTGAGGAEQHGPDAVSGTVRVRQGRLGLRTDGHGEKIILYL